MIASSGGGKVTVEGLAAEKILMGNTVVVEQGTRIIKQTEGVLRPVFCCANYGYSQCWTWWTGTGYKSAESTEQWSATMSGLGGKATVVLAMTWNVDGWSLNGKRLPAGLSTVDNVPLNTIQVHNAAGYKGGIILLGF